MIDVKAARRTQEAPSVAQIYAQGAEAPPARSRIAVVLVGAVIALASFVQSLFARDATEAPPAPKDRPGEDEAGGAPQDERQAAQAEADEPRPDEPKPEDETGSIGREFDQAVGSGGPGQPVPGLPDYLNIDSPAFDFESYPFVPIAMQRLEGFGASNDNGFRVSFLASGSGGLGTAPSASIDPAVRVPDFGNWPPFMTGPGPGDDGGPNPGPGPGPEPGIRNRPPRIGPALRLADLGGCQTVTLTMAMLLLGSIDADGDALRVVNLLASRGQISQAADGWIYTPEPGYFGPVTLTYQITDGRHFVQQTAGFDVVEVLVQVGTQGSDELIGTECRDHIEGRGGNDLIEGRGGDDVLLGGAGNDVIYGGAGNDVIEGGDGDDIVFGGAGNDIIRGGAGNDQLHGEDGDDVIYGDAGNDVIFGGAGNDRLFGGTGDDHISGGIGDDVIFGDEGRDVLSGGDGNDELHGGDGDDVIEGNDGDDHLAGDAGNDVLFGGAGNDRLEGGADDDALFGEAGNDCLIGGEGDDYLSGGDGDDELRGSAGNDVLNGGAGLDHVDGGEGDDTVIVDADCVSDVYEGGEGQDTLDLSLLRTDTLVDLVGGELRGAETGSDRINSFEIVIGGAGNDTFVVGGEAAATLSGGEGCDTFKFEVEGRDAGEEAGELIHRILDLEVGDKIVVKQYTLRRRDDDEDDDDDDDDRPDDPENFGRIYRDDDDDDDRPFRFRIEKTGERESTFIDVTVEQDGDREFSIEISGSHRFYYYD